MKKASSWLWGGILVVLGVILGVNALGIAKIDIFFPGWWTLFIIVPSLVGLFTNERKGGALFGLLLGVCLLLGCLHIFPFGTMWKLILPAILVFVGFAVIARSMSNGEVNEKIRRIRKQRAAEHRHNNSNTTIRATITQIDEDGNKTTRTYTNNSSDDENIVDGEVEGDDDDEDEDDEDDDDDIDDADTKEFWSTFSDQEINYKGKEFDGCRIDAVFGGADLDLRGAKIKDNAIIQTCSLFGGVIIYAPENVKVETTSTAIFGSVSDKRAKSSKAKKTDKTIYIDATCIFGGVEIK